MSFENVPKDILRDNSVQYLVDYGLIRPFDVVPVSGLSGGFNTLNPPGTAASRVAAPVPPPPRPPVRPLPMTPPSPIERAGLLGGGGSGQHDQQLRNMQQMFQQIMGGNWGGQGLYGLGPQQWPQFQNQPAQFTGRYGVQQPMAQARTPAFTGRYG